MVITGKVIRRIGDTVRTLFPIRPTHAGDRSGDLKPLQGDLAGSRGFQPWSLHSLLRFDMARTAPTAPRWVMVQHQNWRDARRRVHRRAD